MSFDNMIDLGRNLGGIFLAVFYVAIVLWTYKDARRRIDDPILVATAVATSMLPVVGVFVYMLLRPPEYLADVRERELEIRAMERALGRQERCPYCKSHIEGDYLSCPVCMTKLRQPCNGCERPLDPKWAMCPYCETEVPRAQREPAGRPGRGRAPLGRPGREERPTSSGTPRSGETRRTPESPRRSGSGSGAGTTTSRPGERSSEARPTKSDESSRPSRGIDTEPFASSRGPRFVRGGDRPAGGSPEQPTMVTPAPGSTPDRP